MLIYKIDVLSTLKNNGINTNKLRKEKLLSEGAIQRLRHLYVSSLTFSFLFLKALNEPVPRLDRRDGLLLTT